MPNELTTDSVPKRRRGSGLRALFTAQKLAFGPLIFQAVRTLRETGALAAVYERGDEGARPEDVAEQVGISLYGARVLLEAGLAAEVFELRDERYVATAVAYFLLHDRMTGINLDFVHDVCYQPAFHFEDAIRQGRPAGLREHGSWPSLYEALPELPPQVRKSWFAFDHFYSDSAFRVALPHVFGRKPQRILDVGGNTGKFARVCCGHDPNVKITIVDLPGQLQEAARENEAAGLSDRIQCVALDLLDPEVELPTGHDVIWMSQFLDCFSEEETVDILRRAAAAMNENARLYVLELLWDRQRHEAARYSLISTSLYFTVVANGNSKMFHSVRLKECIRRAGLELESEADEFGFHSLLVCRRA